MAKKKATKKAAKKVAKKAKKKTATQKARRTKPYPSIAFEDALVLGRGIWEHGSGQSIKRMTLMEMMSRSPTSSTTRAMITNSGKYGITEGSYKAESLSLTAEGKVVCSDASNEKDKLRSVFRLAIENVAPFKAVYDKYVGSRMPAKEVVKDFLIDHEAIDIDEEDVQECIDTFVVNCKTLGVLRPIAGTETLVPLDNVLDGIQSPSGKSNDAVGTGKNSSVDLVDANHQPSVGDVDWEKACFYISPIGDEDSCERKHSDLFLSSLVRPAAEELGLLVKRADEIDHAGMITAVIMEWIDKAKLVVADLSMLNPNVFYEIALRHAKRKPLVCIIQKSDKIPFDINQLGVVVINNEDLYSFVPEIESYQSQIAAKARRAIEDPDAVGNPLVSFYPEFWPK